MPLNMVTVAIAVLSSGALSAAISGFISYRTSKSVERLKMALERGLYVTKAHYDLELESFKQIWAAFSSLSLKARAFIAPDKFKINTPDGEIGDWYSKAYPRVAKDFFDAHDTALRIVTEYSPFYPSGIRQIAEQIFVIDLQIVSHVSKLDGSELSEPWFEKFRQLSGAIDKRVREIEELIRERLDTLRIVS
jgi:hypothetical protein